MKIMHLSVKSGQCMKFRINDQEKQNAGLVDIIMYLCWVAEEFCRNIR